MNNKRATKRALLTSVMALVMCVVMLVGTTFAWFTDTASTAVNKIVAGNLDIEVKYRTTADGEWKTLDNATDLFGAADTRFEPGHTRVVELKIKNAGNLALKYKIGMNVVSETEGTNKDDDPYKLSNYLKVATTAIMACNTGNPTTDATAAWFDTAVFKRNFSLWKNEQNFGSFELEKTETGVVNQLLPNGEVVLGMKVWMPESVGNEANAKTSDDAASISFGLNILATQYIGETDSFGNNYDKDATYPVVDNEGLKNAIGSATNGSTVVIASGEYDLPKSAVGKTEIPNGVTIAGAGKDKTVLATDSKDHKITGDNVTIKDVTIDGTEHNAYDGSGAIKLTGDNAVLDNVNLIGGGQGTYGHTLGVDPKGDTVTTIRNATISGAFRAIQSYSLNGTLLIENSTLAPQCYCLNVDAGTGKLVVNDSALKGWTSYTSSVESATFTNCTFEKNQKSGSYGYNYLRPYTTTTLENCVLGDGFMMGAGAADLTITFKNCTYKGVALTADSIHELFDGDDLNLLKACTITVDGVTVNL